MSRPAGYKHTEETKAKISRSTQETKAKAREMGHPPKRRCTNCGTFRPLKEFSWRKRKLVSGEVSLHPYPRCKPCERERVASYRDQIDREELRQRDREAHRRRVHKRRREERLQRRVPAGPFLEFFDRFLADTGSDEERIVVQALGEHGQRILYRARHEVEQMSLWNIDAVLTSIGHHDQLRVLYPDV